jgi:FkbM family methyltransferase
LAHYREHQIRVDQKLLARIAEVEQEVLSSTRNLEARLDELTRQIEGGSQEMANLAIHTASFLEGMNVDDWRAAVNRRAGRRSPDGSSDEPPAVRLQTDVGPMLYPADDPMVTPWVAQHGCWEPEESQLLRSLLAPGMTFVDVGAHVGYHTVSAAHRIGSSGVAIALEPSPANFRFLCANLLLAGASQVEAIPAAAWRKTELLELGLCTDNSGDHRISDSRGGRCVTVQAVAVDDIIPADLPVHVVKVDVQGRDHIVVEGMAQTASRCRPTVLVEFWPEGIKEFGDNPENVLDSYRALDLRIQILGDLAVDGISNTAIIDTVLSWGPGAFRTLVLTPKESNGLEDRS